MIRVPIRSAGALSPELSRRAPGLTRKFSGTFRHSGRHRGNEHGLRPAEALRAATSELARYFFGLPDRARAARRLWGQAGRSEQANGKVDVGFPHILRKPTPIMD
jgi:hypothetical protein